jgi:glucokinase
MKVVGCDLGGTNLRAAVVDAQTGQVFAWKSIPTLAREGHDSVMQRMSELILTVIQDAGFQPAAISAAGIGVPGVLDMERGVVLFLPNLPGTWPDVPLAETVTQRTGLPVFVMNDARAITFGEWKFGAGRGVETMACFTLGTGIGGGLVINGRLHLGLGGAGGELGHQTIDFNGPQCGCGNYGCLETYASGPAISAMGMKAVAQGLTTNLGKMVEYDLNRITPKVIAQAALAGDEISKDIYRHAGYYLGIAIANILVTINPRKVVLAGGVAAAGDLLLDPIRRTVSERVFVMPKDQVEIVLAGLGKNSGIVGAALWAAQQIGF